MKTYRTFILPAACLGLVLLAVCSKGPKDISGGVSETGNTAMGKLYKTNSQPAAGAKVRFVPVDHNPSGIAKAYAAIDSTVTDVNGNFSVDSLPDGTYNIFGELNGELSFQDSVTVAGGSDTTVANDTVKAAGSLAGIIDPAPANDSEGVYVLVFGSNTFTSADSVGRFMLSNLAEGTYSVRILTTMKDYGKLDTHMVLRAGIADSAADTIRLPYAGIPVPTGLKIYYDTLMQVVTLAWDRMDTVIVKGYNVYRAVDQINFSKINPTLIDDTFFADGIENGLRLNQSYSYKVTAVDESGNESFKVIGKQIFLLDPFIPTSITMPGRPLRAMPLVFRNWICYPAQAPDLQGPDSMFVYDTSGRLTYSWQVFPSNPSLKMLAVKVLNDSTLIVGTQYAIYSIDLSGQILGMWPSVSATKIVAIDSFVFRVKTSEKEIVKYSSRGDSIRSFGLGDLGTIADLSKDLNGNVLVLDHDEQLQARSIKKFTSDGAFLGNLWFLKEAQEFLGTSNSSIFVQSGSNALNRIVWEISFDGVVKGRWPMPANVMAALVVFENGKKVLVSTENGTALVYKKTE